MKHRPRLFIFLAGLAVGLIWAVPALRMTSVWAADAPATVVVKPWPQDVSDIKPDPAAVFGSLPNGFRYIIVPNKEPPGRVSLRLRVNAGSLMESEDQRGLAHFTEHMAFNGSKHFPPGDGPNGMVSVFQRLGMGFGADTNANTSYQRTLYMLDLPDTADNTVREGLQYFDDVADGLLLLQSEVDRERGVILSEKRDRDSVEYRNFTASWDFYFPDSLLPKRQPIGLQDVISTAQRDRFVAYYQKWYTSDRMTLIVVGDVKPEDMIALINEYFGPIVPRTQVPDPDLGKFGTPDFKVGFHREPEAPAVTLELTTISPFSLGPDRVEREAKELRLDAANFIISRRLERITRQPNAPIIGADASSSSDFDALQSSGIEASCQTGQWQTALNVIEQELRRALQYGFSAAEVDEARANFLNNFEESAKAAATRKSRALANAVAETLDENQVFTSPAEDLELAKPVLAALTPEQCLDALKQAWSLSGRRLYVAGNLDFPDATQTLTDAYSKSVATTVDKPVANTNTVFGYNSIGTPGAIVDRHEIPDLGITQLRFANNVRVNLKHTDFEANKIHVLVQFGGGQLDLPADKPGLAFMTGAIFTEGGLGKHSADELQRVLAGKTVGAGFSVGDDFFSLGGVTSPQDFRLQLELLKAYLIDPGYRQEAMALARRELPALYNNLHQNVEAVLDNEVPRLLASGDPRFGYPTQAQAEAVSMDDIIAWIAPSLLNSYMEVSIVGDYDPATIEAQLAATFGTLPPRALNRTDYSAVRHVQFPVEDEGTTKTFKVPSVIPKAEALDVWPTTDESDIQRVRELSVLAEVFSDRLRIEVRQKLGEAYSPEVFNDSSDLFPKYGYATSLITADPKLAADLSDQARVIGEDLAAKGVTQDEFDRAVIPLRKSIGEYRRQNTYWLSRVLAGSQFYTQHLDWARTLPTAYDQVTVEQVTALAKEYFDQAKAVRILVLPEPPDSPPPAATPAVPAMQ